MQSSVRILGPAAVLASELFDRVWQPVVSSDGVASEVSRLRRRTLVDNDHRWRDWPAATDTVLS
jgi:hypothetical protein